jgi:fatty-acyl-CoA synthase
VDITESDRLYTALPLYHSAACLIGVSTTWNSKGTLILRRKFSAHNFWKDIAIHKYVRVRACACVRACVCVCQ